MKFKLLLLSFLLSATFGWGQTVIFNETVGAGAGGTAIGSFSGWSSTGLVFSGSGDVRNTNVSSGYAGVTGAGNVYLNASGEDFVIDGINAAGYTALTFSFGVRKNSNAENGSGLVVEYSTSGVAGPFTSFNYASALPTGTGTVGWHLRTPNNVIPSGITTIRFRLPAVNDFRIDDIILKGTPSGPALSTSTLTAFGSQCVGGTYGSNSFTITGSSLSTADVLVGALSGYTYSTTAGGVYTPSLTLTQPGGAYSQTIYVKFNPIVASSYNGNIPVSGGGASSINVAASGSGTAQVTPGVTIAAVPAGAICAGTSVTFTATPSNLGGGTASYQWKVNGSNVGTGVTYTSTTFANGDVVTCVLTVTGGCVTTATATSAGTTMAVTAIPGAPSGTINVSANPSCGAATLSYSAPNANIYWQTSAAGVLTTNNTLTNYTSSATAGSYTIYVRELSGSCWSPATPVTFTVVEPVAITAPPPNRTITDGNNTTFTVSATGTGLTFQWQVDTGSGFNDISLVAPYSAATTGGATKTNTLTITAAPITMNGYSYRCVVSGAAPCGSVTSNSGSLTVSLTAPNNPTAIVPCYGNNTLGLSWTASSGGSAPDGYMVFALAGATAPAATSAVAGNANLYTANSDFSLATVVTPSLGKCLYKGTGTSFTVTGLANLSNYSFKVVAYRGTTGTAWSTGINTNGTWNTPTTNIAIDMPEISALAASIASGQSALTWTRPLPLSCYDEYLVVANQGAVVFTPSGDGTSYTANSVYSGANQVVYKGAGAGVTVTGLTNGTNYCYKVFVRRGTEWSDGVSVCQTPSIVYCASGATSNLDSEIENVTLVGYSTTISNNTTNVCTTGVNNYTAMSADLQVGGTYTLTVEFGDCSGGSQFDGAGGVWIDWNNDGDFLDANETIGTSDIAMTVTDTNAIQNFTINVPAGQPLGNYRMRIVQTEAGTSGTVSPCGTFTYGSTEDYTVQVINACVPTHTVTSFTPTSGPVGTEVIINGTGLTGTTVTFSGVNATIVSNTGTQMVVIIPATATTGMLSVKDSQPCAVDNAYTIITKNNTSCEGVASTTDLIIYDIHDEETGSGGFITLYNGTAATVNLTNYSIWRTTDHDNGAEVDYANLTGTIAPGALGILKVSVGSCGPASTNGTIDGGFNENDGIQLRNAAGTVIIDDVDTYPTAAGYYMVRNTGALNARVSYVAADWSTTPLAPGECYPSAGLVIPSAAIPPVVTAHPSYTPSCGSTSATLTMAGTEGYAGGLTLAYQWYFVAPGSATWTAVTDGGIYSGATTAVLTISSVSGVINNQYYCQIRENSATCYTATNAVKITDTSASTWNGTTWIGGTPTISKAAIIDGAYVTATNGNFSCCSLTVNGTRTLTISSGGYVEVQNNVNNSGSIVIENNGQLIQINETDTNTGTYAGTAFQVKRTVNNLRKLDYVYWSAPVENFNISSINGSLRYYWHTTAANPNGTQGYWLTAAGNMTKGQGYIVRGPNTFATPQTLSVNFTGKPFNGQFTYPITRGANAASMNDNLILVGNPYPSAIDADLFLDANPNIEGAVHIWTHGILPNTAITSPFYQNYVANYSMSDYIVYNRTAQTIPQAFDGKIASGQGFFVKMNEAGAVSQTITFNNAMRGSSATGILNNSEFFRDANGNQNPEKNRIWLDLINSSNQLSTTVVGYVSGATMEKDNFYDAYAKLNSGLCFYSRIADDAIHIQGRALPFNTEDKIAMGMEIPTAGNHKIAIRHVDGLFSGNQNIYLEDKKLNIIHDLKANPYDFTVDNTGFENNRFVLRFTNTTLGNDDFEATSNAVTIYANDNINVTSSLERIKEVVVYDVLGRQITSRKNISANSTVLANIRPTQSALIVKVTLENGQLVTKKVIY